MSAGVYPFGLASTSEVPWWHSFTLTTRPHSCSLLPSVNDTQSALVLRSFSRFQLAAHSAPFCVPGLAERGK